MGLNPIKTSRAIFNRFSSYATTTLKLKDEELNKQIKKQLIEEGRFSKGPIIEATPPFMSGLSIMDLVDKEILTKEFKNFNSKGLPLNRNLYKHQEEAITKIVRDKRNVVVATGTGSGKTETFMIPIINHLLAEKGKGQLNPGVRALLLYPMNALANDQMKRLREIFANEPKITFGIYTGETEGTYEQAYDKFIRMHQVEPLKNELIAREQMKKTPPNILLTNYAMLEYLMLRPEDNVFFQGEYANNWKYVVIDEAHTYTGAKGIEMSMLISRLKSTIGLREGDLTCIMTSASLGSGKEDFPKVAEFGTRLFHEEFLDSDIVEATKEELTRVDDWGTPNPRVYAKISQNISVSTEAVIKEILRENNVPDYIVNKEFNNSKYDLKGKLYNIFREDARINNTIEILSGGPILLEELAKEVFKDEPNRLKYTAELIDLCNSLKRNIIDNPLIPARYHFLIKALEGAFVILLDEPRVYLNRMNSVTIEDKEYKAFEISACTRCNSLYLVGETITNDTNGYTYLAESNNKYFDSENGLEFYSIVEDNTSTENDSFNEDEIFETIGISNHGFSTYKLCVHCGGINDINGSETCECNNPKHIILQKNSSKDGRVTKCGKCGATNTKGSVVRRFFLSEDAVSSVLATALYNEIPNKTKSEKENHVNSSINDNDIFAFLADSNKEEVKKQLLIFSDSRQNAAYFATYLNNSYQDILIKRILKEVLEENREDCINNKWTLNDYFNRIVHFIEKNNLFLDYSTEELQTEIWKWIIGEFIGNRGNNTLENLGFIGFIPNFEGIRNIDILLRIPLFMDLGFSEYELLEFYRYLIDQFRFNRAILYPEYVRPTDEYFNPIAQQGGITRSSPIGEKKGIRGYSIKSWIPKDEIYTNSRIDYLDKVLKAKGINKSKKEIMFLLENIFNIFSSDRSPLYPFIKTETVDVYGKIFKIDPKIYKVVPEEDSLVKYYQCDTCFKITSINIEDVCPAYRCEGNLNEINLKTLFKDNHYRKIYTNMKLEKMDVHEHTAQLKTEYAAEVQNRFIKGDINVLSCSTTFELGVDVGDLETVFMKNMPPTPANYAQRAGRAGRRSESTAYALSYARLASHDFNSFSNPYKMISGIVKPPYFDVTNEKIAKRHLYACALASFWREHRDYFKNVECFFRNDNTKGPDLLYDYLSSKPSSLLRMIRDVIPSDLHSDFDIEGWGWVEDLYSKDGIMTKVVDELEDDINNLEIAKLEAIQNEKFWRAEELKRAINTILNRPLINFLSQKNILPKYGFPVDVVNLEVNQHTDEAKNIELSRDLQIALSEYAPGSQVVANGKLWTSRYIKKIRKKELIRYKFSSCSCGYFNKEINIDSKIEISCPACGNPRMHSGVFISPEFGFITDTKIQVPGAARPEKTYSSRKHFSGVGNKVKEKKKRIGKNFINLTSQNHGELSVINNGKGRGFYICRTCGFGTVDGVPKTHKNPQDRDCHGNFEKVSLGYNFETDIIEIDFGDIFENINKDDGFWESVMYSIIEGMSSALEIDRSDIDGTLFVRNNLSKTIILFDTVPGGAGHVKRLMDDNNFKLSLERSLEIVSSCTCGGEKQDTSCYNCLRNYYNQYCHDKMKRSYAIEALRAMLLS